MMLVTMMSRLGRLPMRVHGSCAAMQQSRDLITIKKFSKPETQPRVVKAQTKAKAIANAPLPEELKEPVRVARGIAMSGFCSRREAEKHILAQRVTVSGQLITDVATKVDLTRDIVAVDGRVLSVRKQPTKVWMANKLPGELVTASDPQGRATIFDRLRIMGLPQHLMPVGRLDFNTEGLLLLTNDGDYARTMEHPKTEVPRVYRALVRGNVGLSKIEELRRGPLIDGIKYRSIQVTVESTNKKDSWLQVKITEGKNREIRKALAHVRLVLKRLIRVQYGPYRLADLSAGAVLEMKPKLINPPRITQR